MEPTATPYYECSLYSVRSGLLLSLLTALNQPSLMAPSVLRIIELHGLIPKPPIQTDWEATKPTVRIQQLITKKIKVIIVRHLFGVSLSLSKDDASSIHDAGIVFHIDDRASDVKMYALHSNNPFNYTNHGATFTFKDEPLMHKVQSITNTYSKPSSFTNTQRLVVVPRASRSNYDCINKSFQTQTSHTAQTKALFYGVLCPSVFGALCPLYNVTPFNMYHLVSLFASVSSAAFVLFYVHVLLFARNVCYFEMTFQKINGINYIPYGMVVDKGRSFDSLSMIAHVRGSTIHKHHTFYVNFGSFSVLMGALMKLFDLRDHSEPLQQTIAVYMLMIAGIGGIMHGNIEVYSSPTYSVRYNL
eukprot:38590_1